MHRSPESADLFTREKVEALAAEIGVSDDRGVDQLLEQLTTIAVWHQPLHEIFGSDVALLRKRLDLVRKNAGALVERIDDLDSRTLHALTMSIGRRRRQGPLDSRALLGGWTMIRAIRDLVNLLDDAARRAIELTPSGAGHPSHKALNQTVLELAQLYQDFSGKKFTREKERGIWTASAEWVAKVAEMLTPEGALKPTRSQLNTAMRYAVCGLRTTPRAYVPWLDESPSESEDLQESPP